MVTPVPVPGEPHQLKVTVTDTVETFFLRVFGMDQVTIRRDATWSAGFWDSLCACPTSTRRTAN